MGYVAELQGDRETASFFYAKALEARKSDVRVATATRKEAEGQKLGAVASLNDQAVDAAERTQQEIRRRQGAPPALLRRDNTPVTRHGPAGSSAELSALSRVPVFTEASQNSWPLLQRP